MERPFCSKISIAARKVSNDLEEAQHYPQACNFPWISLSGYYLCGNHGLTVEIFGTLGHKTLPGASLASHQHSILISYPCTFLRDFEKVRCLLASCLGHLALLTQQLLHFKTFDKQSFHMCHLCLRLSCESVICMNIMVIIYEENYYIFIIKSIFKERSNRLKVC